MEFVILIILFLKKLKEKSLVKVMIKIRVMNRVYIDVM